MGDDRADRSKYRNRDLKVDGDTNSVKTGRKYRCSCQLLSSGFAFRAVFKAPP